MNISIGNLMITSFCSKNINHLKFRKELKQDEYIYEFVTIDIEKDLIEATSEEKIEIDNSYIIQDNDKLVGYICLKPMYEEKDIVELRYAVHPEYRRLNYGKQILEECRNYLLSFNYINDLELHIRKDNNASIGCAEKAKYKRIGENDLEYYYIYRAIKGVDNSEN